MVFVNKQTSKNMRKLRCMINPFGGELEHKNISSASSKHTKREKGQQQKTAMAQARYPHRRLDVESPLY